MQVFGPPTMERPSVVLCSCCGQAVAGLTPHRHNHNWTAEQDAFIERAAQHGASMKLIAFTLSTEPSTVAHRIAALRKFAR